ncbi:MAG: response regulator [Verrucomicrobia bacterium]|nr:response regulator [Verrucomicrobiota bacterium]
MNPDPSPLKRSRAEPPCTSIPLDWKEALFNAGDEPLAICDERGQLVEVNVRAARLLGVDTKGGEKPRSMEEFLTASSWNRLLKALRREQGAEEDLTGISLIVRSRISMMVDLQLTPISGGYLLLAMRDAGRRWRMESHVHRRIAAIHSSRDVVYLTDAEGRITFVNAAFQGMTGHPVEGVLGQSPSLVRAPGQDSLCQECEKTVAEGRDWIGEYQNLRKDGTTYPVELLGRLESIDKAANKAVDVTQQLLSFSHASEEKEMVLDFNTVVHDACDLATRSVKGRVKLVLDLQAETLKVKIDTTRAQQALLNLCVNAKDAMPQGGELRIATEIVELTPAQAQKAKVKPGAAFVRCSVRDTGTGIPQELLSRIFDPFFTTKEKGKGTGLGLAIVHNVVAKAGGFLEVESVINQGTTFLLYFPVATELLTTIVKKQERPLLRGTGRVLVVDDLDLVREYTETFLTEAGYQVVSASSAEEALAILIESRGGFDLMLTDYNMSGQSGWQLIRETSRQWPSIRFILASGYLEAEERERMQQEGKVRILNKPFKMQDAAELVADVLGLVPSAKAA